MNSPPLCKRRQKKKKTERGAKRRIIDLYNSMGDVYGLVLCVIIPFIIILVSSVIYYKRNHPFIQSRKPDFILLQNAGVLCSFTLTVLYIGLRPDFPCKLNILSMILNNNFIGFVIVIRSLEYYMRFRISSLKADLRINGFQDKPTFLSKFSWLAKHTFVQIVLAIGILLLTIPGLYYFTIDVHYDKRALVCIMPASFMGIYRGFACVLVAAGLVIAFCIRHSRDAYKLRLEFLSLGILWALVLVLTESLFAAPVKIQRVFPPTTFQLLAHILTVGISNFMPLYNAWKIDRHPPCSETFEDFTQLLKSENFRNKFYSYLSEQFCGENLQFYESVQSWKANSDGSQKRPIALLINERFVVEGAVCQVSIKEETRVKIEEMIFYKSEIPLDTFDAACADLLQDMYCNSFILFRATRECVEATYTELV